MDLSAFELLHTEAVEALEELLHTSWFYYLDLLGTLAFAISGALKAYKLDYDYFGTFMLVGLPAVGGGTLRDVVVGGDRHPPFIFHDPVYLYIVFAVTAGAIVSSRLYVPTEKVSRRFNLTLDFFDTVGMGAFTVIGAKVAIVSGLSWYWAPILAAITCSGGSLISNAVTSHAPEVLMGELYEEVAALGGLFMVLGLVAAQASPQPAGLSTAVVLATMVGTFLLRWMVIKYSIKSPTLRSTARAVREPATARVERSRD